MHTHERFFIFGAQRYLVRLYTWNDLPVLACTEVVMSGEVYTLGIGTHGRGHLENLNGVPLSVTDSFLQLRHAMQNWLNEVLGNLAPILPTPKHTHQTPYRHR